MSASFLENPFHRLGFWGRQHELRTIRNRLFSDPPQHCVIIGETYVGKTRLLSQLAAPQGTTDADELKKFTMIYLDCVAYTELTKQSDYASALFWWELYSKLQAALQAQDSPTITKPKLSMDQELIEIAFQAKSELEDLLRNHKCPVIILLDNFEGVAWLPIRNSHWLRSLGQSYCTYIVASRHLLYLLYQYDPKESQFNLCPCGSMI